MQICDEILIDQYVPIIKLSSRTSPELSNQSGYRKFVGSPQKHDWTKDKSCPSLTKCTPITKKIFRYSIFPPIYVHNLEPMSQIAFDLISPHDLVRSLLKDNAF